MSGLPVDDGGWEGWDGWDSRGGRDGRDGRDEDGWVRALDAGRLPESGGGGGGGRGGRGDSRGSRGARDDGDSRDKVDETPAGAPEDRPWTPIPRQAKAAEPGLIPKQRRLKKTSRSA
ncbi:hypothetical protein ABIA31_002014 [Catenulispora sp. MAP5-51]